jgi:hypothetical protein
MIHQKNWVRRKQKVVVSEVLKGNQTLLEKMMVAL